MATAKEITIKTVCWQRSRSYSFYPIFSLTYLSYHHCKSDQQAVGVCATASSTKQVWKKNFQTQKLPTKSRYRLPWQLRLTVKGAKHCKLLFLFCTPILKTSVALTLFVLVKLKNRCFGNGVLCQPYICSKKCYNGDAMVQDVKRITQDGTGVPAVLELAR